jgi:uncharacterized phiE125 gp8 family phage protein
MGLYRELIQVIPPIAEPITIDDVSGMDFMKGVDYDNTKEILFLNQAIATARIFAEKEMNRVIMSQTLQLTFDCLYSVIDIFPKGNMSSVTAVNIVSEDGTETLQASSLYSVQTGDNGRLWLRSGSTWSSTTRALDVMRIKYVAGWANAAAVPTDIKHGLMALLTYIYQHRETLEIVTGVKELNRMEVPAKSLYYFQPHKIMRFA